MMNKPADDLDGMVEAMGLTSAEVIQSIRNAITSVNTPEFRTLTLVETHILDHIEAEGLPPEQIWPEFIKRTQAAGERAVALVFKMFPPSHGEPQ